MKFFLFSILITVGLVILPGCFRLDSFLYVPYDTDVYLLDKSTDDQEIKEETAFLKLPDSIVHQFSIPSANGNLVYGVFIGNMDKIDEGPVVLYCHGNTGNMDNYWPRAKLLWYAMDHNLGKGSVLLFDYQGYGASEGDPTEQALYDDTRAMWTWLNEHQVQDENITLYGYSMGSAPATKLAVDTATGKRCGKLVLEAPFASAEVFAQDASELAMPGSFVVNLQINNGDEIKEVDQPFLWIHGEADDYIPLLTHGQVVFDNYGGLPENKIGVKVPGAEHSNIPSIYGIDPYILLLSDFLGK